MNKRRSSSLPHALHWGALEIAGIYLIIGALWILFSDQMAARVALNEEMLATISLYKGWAYVLITALLLYELIRRHTARLRAGEMQLQRVLDALPVLISYVDKDQHYRFTNSAHQDWFEGGALGKHIREVVGESTYQSALKYIDKVLRGETVHYETEIFLRGGERFISAIYVPDIGVAGEVEGFFTLVQDVTEQKQTLEERRQWADAFEGCAHGIAIGDPNTNRVVVCNPAFAKIQRCSVEDIVGSAILSLYAPLEHEHVRRSIQKADQIGHAGFETKMIRKGGSTFPVEIDVVSILGEDGEVLHRVVTAQDISERKQAQEKLKESEAKYRTLVEHLPAIMYTSEPDEYMGVSYISPQIESLGFDINTWRADPEFWFRQIHPDDQERVTSELQRFQDGAESLKAEYRLLLPNGETRWFHDESIRIKDQSGKTTLKQGFMLDITESKLAEEKLRLQAHWLEQINDAVINSDQNFVITAWNPAAERIYGWRAEEVTGKKGEEILRSEFFAKTRPEILRELRESGEFSAEITQIRKDGSRIHIETRTVTLRDESGHAIGYVSVNRDITERKQVEEENQSLARFPAENPNPVLRATHEGMIIYANAASEPLLQDWGAEVGGYLPIDWVHLIKELSQTGSGKTIDVQCEETTYSVMIVYAPDANAVNIYGRDITERKRAEEALRRSEALLLQTSELAKVGGWELNLQTMTLVWSRETYRIHEVNPSVYPDVEKAINYYAPEARPVIRQAVQLAIAEGKSFDLELQLITARGRRIWVRAIGQAERRDGKWARIFGAFQDITERKQAQEYLRRFELLSEHSRDIILFMGHKDGRILEANAAALQAYGYSRAELLGLTIRDLRASNTLGLTADQMAQADAGGVLFETIHRRKDGTTFPVEVSSQGATINGVRTLISIVRDISERKQTEDALRLKDQLLHLTSEMAKVGGWEFDPVTGKGTWTDEVARIHDLDPAQETNVEVGLSFYLGESREKIDQAIKEAIELGKPYDLELEMVTALSNHKWARTMALPVVQDGKVVKVQGIFQDITERKQIEQALQAAHDELEIKVQERTAALSEANALLQALMDNMPDHIYFKDTQSRFIKNSRSQASLLGLNDPSEARGKTDFDFFPHATKSYAEEQEVMRSGKPLVDLEEWVVWPDGRETWVLTTKLPLRNSEGQTIGIFGISHDITERKRTEQAIRHLNADLEKQAEQLQAANKELEAFSYSVSHDLRAPLRAIDGYTRILVEDYESSLDEEGKRICSVISREARRMGQLIDDLLSFSRLGRREMYSSKIEMRTLAVSVLNELLKEEQRERLDIHIAKLPAAKGDSSLIRQVWVNLLANAIKFTSKKEKAVIEVSGKTTKDEFIYYVRDNGAGFEMEYANKLFGVFQRLHSESEFSGTGVGLAIVQRIIRRHDGRVWAEGEVEKGATFYFALPRKENLS